MNRIGIIGGGNIGEALLSGLIADGFEPREIYVAERSAARRDELRGRYHVVTTEDSTEAAQEVDVLFSCVKPDVTIPVLDEVGGVLDGNDADTVVVSVAAGVTIGAMEAVLPAGTPVVRVMPNTPMLIGKGTSAIAGGRFATADQLETVRGLLGKIGEAVIVQEKDIDAVTAVSGSGRGASD